VRRSKNSKIGNIHFLTTSWSGRPPRVCDTYSRSPHHSTQAGTLPWFPPSAANVGADKDGDKRQRGCKAGRFDLIREFTDAAVSVADPIESRAGFTALLDRIEGNGVRTVIVEDASRFARELIAQELGILALINRAVRVLTAKSDDLTDSSDPSRVMMRQIAGAFHRYEKARFVAKLKAARQRKREGPGQG
jgi:resolvase-like protein